MENGNENLYLKELVKIQNKRQLLFSLSHIYLQFAIISLIILILFCYIYYFHSKQLRWFNSAIMIQIEPENRDYCKKMATFFYNYYYCQHFQLDNYLPEIQQNLYFYSSSFDNDMNNIDQTILKNDIFKKEAFHISFTEKINALNNDEEKIFEYKENYIESIEKLVNSNFRWSSADKFKKNDKYKDAINNFFEQISDTNLTNKRKNDIFNDHMKSNSIFNFVDLNNISEMYSILNNDLSKKYGKYLSNSLYAIVSDINEDLKNKYGDSYIDTEIKLKEYLNENSTALSINESPPINDLFDNLLNQFKSVYFDLYNIDEEYFHEILIQGFDDIDNLESKEKCKKKNLKNPVLISEAEKESFQNAMRVLVIIYNYKQEYSSTTDKTVFRTEYYYFIEQVVFTTFDLKNHSNVFGENTINNIITIYQTIIDLSYLETDNNTIMTALRFTIYQILSPDPNKDLKLEALIDLYVSFNEIYMINENYKATLIEYNNKRNPSLKKLKELYIKAYDNILNYFIIDGIVNQFKKYFTGKRPPRYSWILSNIIDYIGGLTPNKIMDMVMGKEGFEQHDDKEYEKEHFTPDKEIEVEQIFGGIGKLIKAFSKLPKFLTSSIKILDNILNPFKLIEEISKFVLIFILVVLKLFTFTMKLGEMYMIGEYLLYIIILNIFGIVNIAFFIVLGVLISVLFFFDIWLTRGYLYRIIYWLVGSAENAPSSWYKHSGYHYGYDSCKQETDCEDRYDDEELNAEEKRKQIQECKKNEFDEQKSKHTTKCNNYYQNKVKRMFLAYYACGDQYKPDRDTKGFACVRKYTTEPGYCLQANIYRLKENLPVKFPIVPGRFIPSPEYLNSSKKNRRVLNNKFKKMKSNFYYNCKLTMNKYNNLSKNVCRLHPLIIDSKGDQMKSMCYNAYCVNGSREPFCYKYTNTVNMEGTRNKSLIKRFFVVLLYTIMVAYIINILFKNKLFDNIRET